MSGRRASRILLANWVSGGLRRGGSVETVCLVERNLSAGEDHGSEHPDEG
mgnify:FL=1